MEERRNYRAESKRIAEEERIAKMIADAEEAKRLIELDKEAQRKAAEELAAKKAKKKDKKKGKKN